MARHEEQPYVEGRETGRLWQFESLDGGHSWSEPRETEILGKPPHLLRLKDGRIVVTYGYRLRPTDSAPVSPKMVAIRGNYKNEVVLRADGPNHDLGYPATVECVDGTLLSAYYQWQAPEEKPRLMTTRWQILK